MRMKKANSGLKGAVRCAVIGYGETFNMGKNHIEWMRATGELEPVAVCDVNSARLEAAQRDYSGIETYNSVHALLKGSDIDLVAVVTPHNTHASLAIKCLRAGKHVVVEKPMCITVREADRMIAAAEKAGVMLSVFQNRRWDGDFLAMKEVIEKGTIGEVFHVEIYVGGYHHPGTWWRSDKKISGGAFYDWGAHAIDWLLQLVPRKVESVTGFFHKRVWMDATNEDQVEAVIRFEGGVVANVQMSLIARIGKPRWRILGTKGGILDHGQGSFRLFTERDGYSVEGEVKYKETNWQLYYQNIADHLLRGKPLAVTPESARRVIAIMEYAERSSKSGKSEKIPQW